MNLFAGQAAAAGQTVPTIGRFLRRTRIAYFSMEIAVRPEMHTYSGGLGGLAGDTARTAADLELPMVFVTLISRKGYLRQEVDRAGRQIAYPDPWEPAAHAVPLRAMVAVPIGEREVWVRPWLHVLSNPLGREIPILLLDTDIPDNHPDDRAITDRLYGGDERYRLKQEIVLGIAGLRVLQALGFRIDTYHLNEGHAALLALDLLRRFPREADPGDPHAVPYEIERVRERCVFTTHTPVEAGHDRFSYALVGELLGHYLDLEQFKAVAGDREWLNMSLLALRLSGYVNGVAVRHAETATRMFRGYRVRAVTNGIHLPTWTHPVFARLYDAHIPGWASEPEQMVRADQIPDEAVWAAHQAAKRDLIATVGPAGARLRPDLPLIGFARRMTGYKRPALIFSDLDRLRRIAERHPFQLVIAGKAHPRDDWGQQLLAAVHQAADALGDRLPVVFLPGYDLGWAKTLVSGVDVWLNTPIPPMEASGI